MVKRRDRAFSGHTERAGKRIDFHTIFNIYIYIGTRTQLYNVYQNHNALHVYIYTYIMYTINRYEAIYVQFIIRILMTNREKPVSDIVRMSASENFIRRDFRKTVTLSSKRNIATY